MSAMTTITDNSTPASERANSPTTAVDPDPKKPDIPHSSLSDLHFPKRHYLRRPGIDLFDILTPLETGCADRPFASVLEHGRQHFTTDFHSTDVGFMELEERHQVDGDVKALAGVVAGSYSPSGDKPLSFQTIT